MRAGDVHEVSMCRSVKKSVLAGGQKKSMSANYIHVRRCLPNRHHIVSIYLPFSRTQPPFLGLKELPTALHHEDLTRYCLSLPVSHLDQRNVELFELFANTCNWQTAAKGVTWGWSVGSHLLQKGSASERMLQKFRSVLLLVIFGYFNFTTVELQPLNPRVFEGARLQTRLQDKHQNGTMRKVCRPKSA